MNEQITERAIRIECLRTMESRGIEPYPSKTARTHTIRAVLDGFDHFCASANIVTIAGRIIGLREHGGSLFADLEDGTGRMQIYLKKDELKNIKITYEDFLNFVGIGDFIEVTGTVFQTKADANKIQKIFICYL